MIENSLCVYPRASQAPPEIAMPILRRGRDTVQRFDIDIGLFYHKTQLRHVVPQTISESCCTKEKLANGTKFVQQQYPQKKNKNASTGDL